MESHQYSCKLPNYLSTFAIEGKQELLTRASRVVLLLIGIQDNLARLPTEQRCECVLELAQRKLVRNDLRDVDSLLSNQLLDARPSVEHAPPVDGFQGNTLEH